MSGTFTVCTLISTSMVGLLIGKNGASFREMAESSQTKLFLQSHEDMPESSRGRALILTGTKDTILLALNKIFDRIILKSLEINEDDSYLVKWVIKQCFCGILIGRNGDGIKKINEFSGAWVKVAHLEEFVSGTDERYTIYTTPLPIIHLLIV